MEAEGQAPLFTNFVSFCLFMFSIFILMPVFCSRCDAECLKLRRSGVLRWKKEVNGKTLELTQSSPTHDLLLFYFEDLDGIMIFRRSVISTEKDKMLLLMNFYF